MDILEKRARNKGIPMTDMIKQEARKLMDEHSDFLDLRQGVKKDSLNEIRILKDNGK